MTIGELAQAVQCTVATIRFYEKEGLLAAPRRTAGNYRSYGPRHLERLRFVRHCRTLDMTHGEIRALLALMDQPGEACGAVNELLDAHILRVRARARELAQLEGQLQALRDRCRTESRVADCGILRELAEPG